MPRRLLMLLAGAAVLVAAASPKPPLPSIDQAGYAKLTSARSGHALVVNMWATWCEPCREEFPDLVRLDREMAPRGLDLVGISLDAASDAQSAVVPFLEKERARFTVYIKKAGDDDAFINAVDPSWSGALPATFVYDAKGKLVRSIQGPTTFAELKRIVEPLLGGTK